MYKNTLFTHRQRPWLSLLFVVLLVVVVSVLWPQTKATSMDATAVVPTYTPSASTTVPLQVSGVVKAADQTVIRAETNGVVTALPVREGAVVSAGSVLAVQSTPVQSAQLALADAQVALSGTAQASALSAAAYQEAASQIAAVSAAEIAVLHDAGNSATVQETAQQLLTTVSGAALVMVSAMDFVDDNRTLFRAEDIRLYREVVESLYDGQPNYLSNGISYSLSSPDAVVDTLEVLQHTSELDPAEVQHLAAIVETNLISLATLLRGGEYDVFDETTMDRTDPRYSEYLAQRAGVIEQLANVQQMYQALRSTVVGTSEDGIAQTQSAETSVLAATQAAEQARFAATLAAQTAAVAAAERAVVAAQIGLANPTAPFAGTVSQVHATVGEFVAAGTPLVTLVGNGAREVVISVPAALMPLLRTGQSFVVDGVSVGYLDRFSTVGTGAGVTAVIALTRDTIPVGTGISGDLMSTAAEEGVYSLPRGVVRFNTAGAYVVTEAGDVVPVHIVYDAGGYLFVTSGMPLDVPLLKSVGITL